MNRSVSIVVISGFIGISLLYMAYSHLATGSAAAATPPCLKLSATTSLDSQGANQVTARITNTCDRRFARVEVDFLRDQIGTASALDPDAGVNAAPVKDDKNPPLTATIKDLLPGATVDLMTLPSTMNESYRVGEVRTY